MLRKAVMGCSVWILPFLEKSKSPTKPLPRSIPRCRNSKLGVARLASEVSVESGISTGTLIKELVGGGDTKGKLAAGSRVLQAEKVRVRPKTKNRALLDVIKVERMRMMLRVRQN